MNEKIVERRIRRLKIDKYNLVVVVNHRLNEADYCFTPKEYIDYMKSDPSFVQQCLFIWVTEDLVDDIEFWNFIYKEESIFFLKYMVNMNMNISRLKNQIPLLRLSDVCLV